MVDRLKKNFRKLSKKERKQILEIAKRIRDGRLEGLDVKKLKGQKNAFRVRKGDFRIIFVRDRKGHYRLVALERRNEKTYQSFE